LPVLGRTFGFSADRVRHMTVVTADGEIRDVTPEREPDLFWGLRGGKSNLGIVTEMTVGLVPVSRIYGGGIYYPGDAAEQVLHAYMTWSASLSERTSSSISLLRLPPLPELPEPLRGRLTVHLRVAHVGDGGEEVVAPMRAVAPALVDAVDDMPYTDVDLVHQDPDHPVPVYERIALLPALTGDVVDRLLAVAGPAVHTPVLFAELRQLGGALAREPEVPNAVTGRGDAFSLFVLGMLMPEIADIVVPSVDGVIEALRACTSGRTMVNLHGRPGDDADRARAWEPATYARLRALKQAYDPRNLFRYGHAVPLPGEPHAQ
jgi:FAD/FMN-containing dehydrogenase